MTTSDRLVILRRTSKRLHGIAKRAIQNQKVEYASYIEEEALLIDLILKEVASEKENNDSDGC